MLMAQLHGKLPTELVQGTEDILTSAIFGCLKNLPPPLTASLLSKARPLSGSSGPGPQPPFSWIFWPNWDICEPDVVIEDDGNIYLVEAKLYSAFGEDAGAGTQLRREWREGLKRSREVGKAMWLLTVSNHASMPAGELLRQLQGSSADPTHVCWISWSEVARVLANEDAEECKGWCEDLLEVLTRMGLAPFDGFGETLEAASIPRMDLPWVGDSILGGDAGGSPGFADVLNMATSLHPISLSTLAQESIVTGMSVGFSESIAQAQACAENGGAKWLFRSG